MKGNKGMFVQISKGASRGLNLRFRCQEGNREIFLDLIKHLLECFELFQKRPRVLHFIAYKLRISVLNVLLKNVKRQHPKLQRLSSQLCKYIVKLRYPI